MEECENRMKPIPLAEANYKFRKIDRGSSHVTVNPITLDIFITGSDKLLKKYDYPTENLE